jgi:hypothetical protein
VTHADPEWLFEIRHPPSWEASPLLVSHGDTRQWEMLALATYRLEPGEGRCPHLPGKAFEALGPRDALLYIQEPEYVEGLPARPDRFAVRFASRSEYLHEISVFGCLDEKERDFRYAFVPFRDRGRNFYAYLALGTRASDSRRRQLVGVLDSLRILGAEAYRSRH